MKQASLALLFICFSCVCAYGQTLGRRDHTNAEVIEDATADQVVAAQSILILKRLDDDVIVYRSLGEFEDGQKLARVSFETFKRDLNDVSREVEGLLSRLADSRMKTEIRNALASYRDGAYWWEKIDQPRIVKVSELTRSDADSMPTQTFFLASLPYTVAIHWRQANKHLQRAARQAVR